MAKAASSPRLPDKGESKNSQTHRLRTRQHRERSGYRLLLPPSSQKGSRSRAPLGRGTAHWCDAGPGAQAKELDFRKQRRPVLEARYGAAIVR
jgi:hypothetical protein